MAGSRHLSKSLRAWYAAPIVRTRYWVSNSPLGLGAPRRFALCRGLGAADCVAPCQPIALQEASDRAQACSCCMRGIGPCRRLWSTRTIAIRGCRPYSGSARKPPSNSTRVESPLHQPKPPRSHEAPFQTCPSGRIVTAGRSVPAAVATGKGGMAIRGAKAVEETSLRSSAWTPRRCHAIPSLASSIAGRTRAPTGWPARYSR